MQQSFMYCKDSAGRPMKPRCGSYTMEELEQIVTDSPQSDWVIQTKYDGVCARWWNGRLVSSTNLTFPNMEVQGNIGSMSLPAFHGELVSVGGKDNALANPLSVTRGIISSRTNPLSGTIRLYVHDLCDMPYAEYGDRYYEVVSLLARHNPTYIRAVHSVYVGHDFAKVREFADLAMAAGDEGFILKDLNRQYVYGRCSNSRAAILRYKFNVTIECHIVEVIEGMTNNNPPTLSATGHTKRSSSMEGKEPNGTCGTLRVVPLAKERTQLLKLFKDPTFDFCVSSGISDAEAHWLWENRRGAAQATICTVKFQRNGCDDKPRHPVYLGRRTMGDATTW